MATVYYEQSERDRVKAWRESFLLEAGYPEELAAQLAGTEADLHQAADLLAHGCNPNLAFKIMS